MSLIQIPLEPPTQQVPEQGDLFDAQTWESAYREMHDFPTLLIQTRDELARSRKREALWISLFAHAVLIILILNFPKFEKYLPHRAVMLIHPGRDSEKLTFMELPPDAQKIKPPKTDITSDKNRVATSRAPKLDRDQLKKILDAARQGRPGSTAPQKPPQPTPPEQAQAPPQPQPGQQQPAPPAQVAKLQTPPMEQKTPSPFSAQPMSANRAIDQAERAAAMSKSRYGGNNGDLGLGQRQHSARVGPYEITSDTMGVDFGPYLAQVVHAVKQNWYNIIPPSAEAPLYKKGKLSIEFVILKNGNVSGMHYVISSGDVALDRAAYGGITYSNPFPPLPQAFGGQYLGLRFTFFYNPDPNEADLE